MRLLLRNDGRVEEGKGGSWVEEEEEGEEEG